MITSLSRLFLYSVLLGICLMPAAAQNSRYDTEPQEPPKDRARVEMEKDMAKKANQQRQAELKRDTDKLLKLATELKNYVDKSNENLLSLEVVNKADEIEKLAHSVREKMRGNN